MLQFNLRMLILAVTVFAIGTWIVFVVPGSIGLFLMSAGYFVLPGLAVASVVYSKGHVRAFSIACLPGLILMMAMVFVAVLPTGPVWYRFRFTDPDEKFLQYKLLMLIGYGLIGVTGIGGVMVRFLSELKAAAARTP